MDNKLASISVFTTSDITNVQRGLKKLNSNWTCCRILLQREGSTYTVSHYHQGGSLRLTEHNFPVATCRSLATDVKYVSSACMSRAERFFTRRTLRRIIGRLTASQFLVVDKQWSAVMLMFKLMQQGDKLRFQILTLSINIPQDRCRCRPLCPWSCHWILPMHIRIL